MEKLHKLREILCEELEEIAEKAEISVGDLEAVYKLLHAIKNIDEIKMYAGGARIISDYEKSSRSYSLEHEKREIVDDLNEMIRMVSTDAEREAIRRCMEAVRAI